MQIFDCTRLMSKMYLSRIVDSIIKEDIPRNDAERLREQINQNADELANEERISGALNLHRRERANRILFEEILRALLEQPDTCCGESKLYDQVRSSEQHIIDRAKAQDALALSDPKALDIYRTVLEVALSDEDVTLDEYALLERLRRKLKLSRLEHRILEAQLGHFPTPGNRVHGYNDFSDAIKSLQGHGILFYCNQAEDEPLIVLPQELTLGVKRAIGFELTHRAQRHMQESLTNEQLYRVLHALGLPVSGTKSDRSERLVQAGCKPSEILDALQNAELETICRKLPGVRVSGAKNARRDRIIDYFEAYTAREPADTEDERGAYYEYFIELAARNNQVLHRLGLIERDHEMDSAFEQATQYLFEKKLGCELVSLSGTEHADGAVTFGGGDLLLWDNKSKESVYTFPKAHREQFMRYIRIAPRRVSVFLVIVPEVSDEAALEAIRLKNESPSDTDVAIIRAEDLKYVAESWRKHARHDRFNLKLFNTTGILDRANLEQWMKALL